MGCGEMAIVQKVRSFQSRFGFNGVIATTVAKSLRTPVRMKVLSPGLGPYVHLYVHLWAGTSDLFVYDDVLVQKQYECEVAIRAKSDY
jgi:hypothetical protein